MREIIYAYQQQLELELHLFDGEKDCSNILYMFVMQF